MKNFESDDEARDYIMQQLKKTYADYNYKSAEQYAGSFEKCSVLVSGSISYSNSAQEVVKKELKHA